MPTDEELRHVQARFAYAVAAAILTLEAGAWWYFFCGFPVDGDPHTRMVPKFWRRTL